MLLPVFSFSKDTTLDKHFPLSHHGGFPSHTPPLPLYCQSKVLLLSRPLSYWWDDISTHSTPFFLPTNGGKFQVMHFLHSLTIVFKCNEEKGGGMYSPPQAGQTTFLSPDNDLIISVACIRVMQTMLGIPGAKNVSTVDNYRVAYRSFF